MKPADLTQIVENLVTDREHEYEIWIRPERFGSWYTVEWTTVEDDWTDLDWRPRHQPSNGSDGVFATVRAWLRKVLYRPISILVERMPSFDVDRTQINAFRIDDTYLFKHYFDRDDVFSQLRPYYNDSDYRFEIPADEFTEVQKVLDDHFFDLTVVEDPERFCVVKRKYTDHPDVLFKASVLQRTRQDYNVFLLKDQLSVEQAVNNGAVRLPDADLDVSFP